MSAGRTYVCGAGVAGLAAATALSEAGRAVTLFEAAPRPGGRCRSYNDPVLGTDIDNGNHLVLSGNTDAMRYLARIGAMQTITIGDPVLPFRDLTTDEAWRLDLGSGRLPWWIFRAADRVPGSRLVDYWHSRAVLKAGPEATVADVFSNTGTLYARFWRPLAIAVLNTEPEAASAALLAPVLRETIGRGGAACRPVFANRGLGFSFADPAIDYLRERGADVRFSSRLRGIERSAGRAMAILVDDEVIPLAADDAVVLALPPLEAAGLVDGITVPDAFRAIVNAHFRVGSAGNDDPITGLIGGLSEWLFRRADIASVTVSAADLVIDRPAAALAGQIWHEIAPILGMDADIIPPHRLIKEKRATIAQTPEMVARRPKASTALSNLWIAGDWTDTGLPATIEGAIRSGHQAAALALNK